MEAAAALVGKAPALYMLITLLDNVVYFCGSAFITFALFRLSPRKKAWVFAAVGALCLAESAAETVAARRADDFLSFAVSVFGLLLPYACALLLFRKKGVWKALLVTAGYTFIEALRFIVLLLFFSFDNNNRNEPLELLVEFLVDTAVFLLLGLLLARRVKKQTEALHVTRTAAVLFLLCVASVSVFVTSLMLMGPAFSAQRQGEFAFMLLNVPVLTATVSYALVSYFRMRNENEAYRAQLDAQIRQYRWMEQMNEDLRLFRHDFPKKMRPLIAYLNEDKPGEALQMAEQFSDFVAHTGMPFHTGNTALDTVLFCQRQLAQNRGVTLDVAFDTVFPAEGIAPEDIYTIFPNALDNAVEACEKVQGDKTVRLRARVSGGAVYVTVANPFAGEVKQRGGLPQTTKDDRKNHGYGFRSIKKAAAKYGRDNVSFSAENGTFTLEIRLELKKAPGTG